jgi:hypothetical protein
MQLGREASGDVFATICIVEELHAIELLAMFGGGQKLGVRSSDDIAVVSSHPGAIPIADADQVLQPRL